MSATATKRVAFKVPFTLRPGWGRSANAAGSMVEWASEADPAYEWRDPEEFEAALTLHGFGRGRSAAMFYLRDIQSREYIIRMAEFTAALKATDMHRGRIVGVWGFKKQGTAIGLTFIREVRRGGGWL